MGCAVRVGERDINFSIWCQVSVFDLYCFECPFFVNNYIKRGMFSLGVTNQKLLQAQINLDL